VLKHHHKNVLIDVFYEVSNPRSPKYILSDTPLLTMYSHVPLLCCRYGAHLSKEQVAWLVALCPDMLELVNSWPEHHDVPSSSISAGVADGDWHAHIPSQGSERHTTCTRANAMMIPHFICVHIYTC